MTGRPEEGKKGKEVKRKKKERERQEEKGRRKQRNKVFHNLSSPVSRAFPLYVLKVTIKCRHKETRSFSFEGNWVIKAKDESNFKIQVIGKMRGAD